MTELEDTWDAVHDVLPAGWRVNRPEYHVETRQWHAFPANHRAGRKRPGYIEAVGMDQPH